jgi:hypothetical protein
MQKIAVISISLTVWWRNRMKESIVEVIWSVVEQSIVVWKIDSSGVEECGVEESKEK